MEEFLKFVITAIVDHPKKVKISQEKQIDDPNLETYIISVDPADMGKIIGKQGKIIKALRTLSQVLSYKNKKRAIIKIQE
jgi:hypothetical protein